MDILSVSGGEVCEVIEEKINDNTTPNHKKDDAFPVIFEPKDIR